jgi:hypothetical protein
MTDSKSKFTTPAAFPPTARTTPDQLRLVSAALVGAIFAAEVAREVIDLANPDSLLLFQMDLEEFNALPATNVHPDQLADEALLAQVADDAGWYKRYEDKWATDRASLKECKLWLLAILPADVFNLCIDDAGGEGLEHRPAYTVRDIIPRLIAAIEDQKPAELRNVKAAMERPFNPTGETLESWLTQKRRLVTRATTHLAYQFNDMDVVLSVWAGLAPLHLGAITAFKLDWTTRNRSTVQRTFTRLHTDLLAWERDMADSDQAVFEPTRLSAGFKVVAQPTAPTPATTQDLGHQMAKAKKLSPEDQSVMTQYMDAAFQTLAHRKANPEFKVPPHFCTTHGMCYHTSDTCKSKSSK